MLGERKESRLKIRGEYEADVVEAATMSFSRCRCGLGVSQLQNRMRPQYHVAWITFDAFVVVQIGLQPKPKGISMATSAALLVESWEVEISIDGRKKSNYQTSMMLGSGVARTTNFSRGADCSEMESRDGSEVVPLARTKDENTR